VKAAHRAGIKVVGLLCGGWAKEDLGEADAIYRDPEDLLAHLEQSPFLAH
jgi:phosphoglycolate phosphatase-like HAD superfamily hydrolase